METIFGDFWDILYSVYFFFVITVAGAVALG